MSLKKNVALNGGRGDREASFSEIEGEIVREEKSELRERLLLTLTGDLKARVAKQAEVILALSGVVETLESENSLLSAKFDAEKLALMEKCKSLKAQCLAEVQF